PLATLIWHTARCRPANYLTWTRVKEPAPPISVTRNPISRRCQLRSSKSWRGDCEGRFQIFDALEPSKVLQRVRLPDAMRQRKVQSESFLLYEMLGPIKAASRRVVSRQGS